MSNQPPSRPTAPSLDAGVLIAEAVAKHRQRISDGGGIATVNQADAIETGVRQAASGPPPHPTPPGSGPAHIALLIFGVVHPAAVILIEALTGYCRTHLFDPMPTFWHVGLLAMVPIGNFVLWRCLVGGLPLSRFRQTILNGFVTGIAGFYALLFLPLLPIALVAILVGVGLLPLAPHASFIASLRLASHLKATPGAEPWSTQGFLLGLSVAVLALVALDAQQAVTRHGLRLAVSADPAERARGIDLLRTWGHHSTILEQANGLPSRSLGPLTALMLAGDVSLLDRPRPMVNAQQAREIYYRVTGQAYSSAARKTLTSPAALAAVRQFDNDQGGSQVGGTVPGLSLATSRLDGTINADDAVAYIEWLFEVRNDSASMSEARMAIALPPGAVVSRVTLWVNGVEEEAAFAGRAQVRQAYERVVRRAQDPFLVTTNGADRVLAQAFPVMPNGGLMKFKIGITAPLELDGADKARLVLPAIVDRNFAASDDLRHAVWLESKRALTTVGNTLTTSALEGGGTRIAGEIGTSRLAQARPVIAIARDPAHRFVEASNPETGSAVQEILSPSAAPASTLMLVLDGSVGTKPHVRPILAALDALPSGLPVGLAIANERGTVIAPAPWTPEHRARLREALLTEIYVGGADNTDALIAGVLAAGSGPGARVLWIHGAQPVRFTASKPRFEQVAARIRSAPAPALALYALDSGPNMMLSDAPWSGEARDIPATGDITADLTRALRRMTGQDAVPAVRRTLVTRPGLETEPQMPPVVPIAAKGSSHIVRLAAHDEVQSLMRRAKPDAHKAAVELAGLHRLVTPVSGAVVLESKRQYQEAGLVQGMKGQPGNVPTVPEPHEWALILLAALGLGWLLWQRQRDGADASLAGAA
ncbi:MAG: VIT domain-containing protein [Hyphomicrobiaceae bacterium]